MKAAFEQIFNGSLNTTAITSYDSTKVNLPSRWKQTSADGQSFVGPTPYATASFGEAALALTANGVHPVKISENLWWIFTIGENTTAAATRRVGLWTWTPSNNALTMIGGITLTFPTATAHTVRGMRAVYRKITTGTVAVSGTAVTGSGTTWDTDRIPAGCRIGFGSTDPTAISTWYEVSTTPVAAGALTLVATAGTIAAGTPYVIEDLQIVMTTTNATTTNGGLFVTKGLRFELFTQPVTVISAAVSTDMVRAVYWLKDAATITNITAGGCAIEDATSGSSQFVYVPDGAATTLKVFKYNFRAPLTVASGAATLAGSDLVITGNQTVTGNLSQLNNGRIATLGHGPGSGVSCLYLLTASRILRIPVSAIVGASTTFVADSMTEVPPGGTTTNAVVTTLVSFDVASNIDRIAITGPASVGTNYITQYNAAGAQFERRFGLLTAQLAGVGADSDLPEYPHQITVNTQSIWVEDGYCFLVNAINTATLNQMFIFPMGADWVYGETAIFPKINLAASKLYRVLANTVQNVGDDTMGMPPDALQLYYRTSGIDDNSGLFTAVPMNGGLSGAGAPSSIQFAARARTAGTVLIPARLLSLALLYETVDDLPSQYRWNFGDFNQANGTFAWVQATLFGSGPGVHTINIYRADTDALVLTQASSGSTNGTFENWNGSSWVAGLGADTVGRRRRFVPTGSLPAGVDLYAKLSVA